MIIIIMIFKPATKNQQSTFLFLLLGVTIIIMIIMITIIITIIMWLKKIKDSYFPKPLYPTSGHDMGNFWPFQIFFHYYPTLDLFQGPPSFQWGNRNLAYFQIFGKIRI